MLDKFDDSEIMKGQMILVPAGFGRIERKDLDAPPTIEQLSSAVGGEIEHVPYFNFFIDSDLEWKPCIVFCNENGKLRGLEANPRITTLWQALHRWPVMDIIVGPAVILTGTSALMSAL